MNNLLTHTCNVIQAGSTTDLGHTLASWTAGTTTTTGIACRWQPRVEREMATGAIIATHVLFMLWADAPASLKARGAAKTHRITNVTDRAGNVLDTGPADVVEVQDAAGSEHHLELRLLRAG